MPLGLRDLREKLETPEPRVLRGHKALLVTPEPLDQLDHRDHRADKVFRVRPGRKGLRVKLEQMEATEQTGTPLSRLLLLMDFQEMRPHGSRA